MSNAITKDAQVTIDLKRMVRSGLTMTVILDTLREKYGTKIPTNLKTLYNIYGGDIATARAELHEMVADEVLRRAVDRKDEEGNRVAGSDRLLEFVARSKLGWNPIQTVQVNELEELSPDENTSAVEELANMLNRSKTKGEEQKDSSDDN